MSTRTSELLGLLTATYAATSPKSQLEPFTIERREPGAHDVLVEILYCGICHSDIHMVRDEWKNARYPMVPGHEIVGRIRRMGENVRRWKLGDIVGVGCIVDSCRRCEACRSGEEQFCENHPTMTYGGFERDGRTPTYGGYSTQMTVNEDYVLRVARDQPLQRVAPLLCAGITTYSPLRRHSVRGGHHVAVVGLGGLGHVGVKIAKALGAAVTVISHSPQKRGDAMALGADDFLPMQDNDAMRLSTNRFDFILDTLSAPHDYNTYLNLLKRDCTMVLVGLPEPTMFSAGPLIFGRRNLSGSLIGGLRETQEMLDFCADYGVLADVEVIPIQKVNEAYDRAVKSDVRYRFVIDMASLRQETPENLEP
jgi:alcohol dehydrogenase (NADP+)